GPKAFCLKLLPVGIDLCGALQKCFAVTEEMPVMIQVVHAYFKPAIPNGIDIRRRNLIPLFRHNLKRPFDAPRVVDVHESRRRITPESGFHIMGYDRGPRGTLGPKPNEGDSIDAVR